MDKKSPTPLDYEAAPRVDDSITWQDVVRIAIKLAFAALMTISVMGFLGLFTAGR